MINSEREYVSVGGAKKSAKQWRGYDAIWSIIASGSHNAKRYFWLTELDTKVSISHGLKEEAAYLIRYYKDADFEIVDDDQEIDKNKKITGIFTRDCLSKAGKSS